MAGLHSIVCAILLLTLYTNDVQAGLPKPTIDDPLFSITGQATLEFKNANLSHNGTYTFRVLLRNSKITQSEIDFIILAGLTPTSTQIMPTGTFNPSPSMSTAAPGTEKPGTPTGDKKDYTAFIVGGAIGGVVFLAICICRGPRVPDAIWCFFCVASSGGSRTRRSGGEEDVVANPSNPSYAAGNAYESVDQGQIAQTRDDEAGPSNENPADAGNGLPPVYVVVDKSNRTPKPASEKQSDSLPYASLDPVLLQPDSSKKRDNTHEDTNYASIDLEKLKNEQE